MADDLNQTGRQDDAGINFEQDHERDELRSAVAKAGPMVKNVRAAARLTPG